MKKKQLSQLQQNVDSYVRDLNTSINAAVNKFYAQMSEILEEDIDHNDYILSCTVTFEELVQIVEDIFHREKPFTASVSSRANRVPLIRQLTYYIGASMGHTYNHMYNALNVLYGNKVIKNHATIDHSIRKIRDLLSINDPKCITLRLQIMNAVIKYVEKNE